MSFIALADVADFCSGDMLDIWRTVGNILLVFKIVIPLLLIIFGMIDLGKAVISSDDKAVSKAAKSLLNRVIAAVVVFFIPTLIGFIIGLVGSFDGEAKEAYDNCATCISDPGNCN